MNAKDYAEAISSVIRQASKDGYSVAFSMDHYVEYVTVEGKDQYTTDIGSYPAGK